MHPLAIALVLVSAALHSWRELLTKKSHDKQIFIWLVCLTATVIFFPLFVYEAILGHVTGMTVALALGASVTHAIYWYWMSRAYDGGDLSHVYPIMRSAPALIFILSVFFLHEHVTTLATVGVVTIFCGIYMINMKKISVQGFLEPLRSFGERHTQFAVLTALAVTTYSLQDKVIISVIDPLLYCYFIVVFPTLYWTPFILRKKPMSAIANEWKKHPRDIIINGIIAFASYALILSALTVERVSYVSSLRQISIVFGVLLGGHLLKERHKWIRLSAAGLIFAGTVMIAFAS